MSEKTRGKVTGEMRGKMMKKMSEKTRGTKLLIVFLIIAFLVSCRAEIDLTKPEDQSIKSWGDLFAAYWSGMDHYYLYWDVDKTDWNVIWDTYIPKFDALGTTFNKTNSDKAST
ncbi:MAG: hypothetical protein Ta2G_21490 [Termitinemataceae bacterium]|nr:MAG: hypothetical protein Ta2G_21490 [Termitinemataceae bacterium]